MSSTQIFFLASDLHYYCHRRITDSLNENSQRINNLQQTHMRTPFSRQQRISKLNDGYVLIYFCMHLFYITLLLYAPLADAFLLRFIHTIQTYPFSGRASSGCGVVRERRHRSAAQSRALGLQCQTSYGNHRSFYPQTILGARFDVSVRLVPAPRQYITLIDTVFGLCCFADVYFVAHDHQWEIVVCFLVMQTFISPLGYLLNGACIVDIVY